MVFVLGVLGLVLLAFVVEHATRLRELERRVRELQARLQARLAMRADSHEPRVEEPEPLDWLARASGRTPVAGVAEVDANEPVATDARDRSPEAAPAATPARPADAPLLQPAPAAVAAPQPVAEMRAHELDEPHDSTEPPAAPQPGIAWERWLGVRGAAVAGGIALALASILLFRYSIEHGLVTPAMRLAIGSVAGLACLTGSTPLLRRGYALVADALAGAGLVALYAVLWAAQALYGFVGAPLAFAGMCAVTAGACLLTLRRSSALLAGIALVGGFATPLLIAGRLEDPLGLFGYLLLLDGVFLFLARRRGFPLLGQVCLLLTVFYHVHWIGTRMQPGQVLVVLALLAAFAFLFGAGASSLGVRAAGLLLPFTFGAHVAARAELAPWPWPLFAFLVALQAGAVVLGRRVDRPEPGIAASSAALGCILVWMLRTPAEGAWAWLGVGAATSLLAAPAAARLGTCVLVVGCGGLGVLACASLRDGADVPWPWWSGALALAAAACLASRVPQRAWGQAAAAVLLGGVVFVHEARHGASAEFPGLVVRGLLACGVAALALGWARVRAQPAVGANAWLGAWALALILVWPAVLGAPASAPDVWWFHAFALALCAAAASAAIGLRSALALFAVEVVAAWSLLHWPQRDAPWTAAVLGLLVVAVFCCWPLVSWRACVALPGVWRVAAVMPILAWPSLAWRAGLLGDRLEPELLAAAAGAVVAAVAWRVRALWPPGDSVRTTALAWFGGVAALFLAGAIPHPDVAHEAAPRLALQALAVTLLWRRLDHVGLVGLAALLACASVLVAAADPVVWRHVPTPASWWWNGSSWTFLVPVAALLVAAAVYARHEPARLRGPHTWTWGALACGLGAVVLGFVWINVAVAFAFADGERASVVFAARQPARDLTTSVAWIAYAVVLLVLGVLRQRAAPRWVSLALMLVTVGKVFLHDLGELRDLYRVVSLGGLALSLLGISLLYQRFVFRQPSRRP